MRYCRSAVYLRKDHSSCGDSSVFRGVVYRAFDFCCYEPSKKPRQEFCVVYFGDMQGAFISSHNSGERYIFSEVENPLGARTIKNNKRT